jgi:hypothetical protein
MYLKLPGLPAISGFKVWMRATNLADYLQKSHFYEGRKEEA